MARVLNTLMILDHRIYYIRLRLLDINVLRALLSGIPFEVDVGTQ